MKGYFFSIVVASLFYTSLNATSLKDVVKQTIDANPDVLSEKFNKEAYRKYVDEEKSDYYPTVNFTGYLEDSKTRYNRDDQPNDPSTEDKDGWNATIQIEQILYDGGKTPSEVEEFKHTYFSNKYRSNQRVEEIIREAVDSYMDLVMYQELMNLSENNITLHDDYLVIAKDKEEISGEILESYQVNSKKHSIIDRYLEQKDLQNQARNKYLKYTQRDTDGNVCRPEIDESLIPDTLEKIVEIVTVRNNKVLEQIEKVKEQRENLEQAKAGYLPTLKLQWQSSWDNDLEQPENGREDNHRARLVLEWNLFEGGKTYHTSQQEKLFLQEQQKILDNIVSEVEEEVKSDYASYSNIKERVKNIRKYVVDNRNIRDVYLKQLQDGTRTFIDILDAESELYRSEISALEQEMDLYSKYFDLLEDMGILSQSILKSSDQICKKYVPVEYKNPMQTPENKDGNKIDKDLLKELGVDSKLDNEIEKLINVDDEPTTKKEKAKEKELPTGKYTINLATINKEDFNLDNFKKKYNLSEDKQVLSYNMKSGTKVLYGSFDKLSDAENVMKNLNTKLDLKLYVDYLDKHRKILEKYKNIN